MAEDWDKFWEKSSVSKKIVDFMRHYYFSDVVISHLGNLKNKRVLEAGCGTCESLVKIAKKAKKVVGMDISKPVLSIAKRNFQKEGVGKNRFSLVHGDIQKMKYRSNAFDLVFNAGVIEHFDDNRAVEEMIRVTKKNGKVVILVPSAYSLYYLFYWLVKITGLRKLYPWEDHKFYTFKMMDKQLKPLGIDYKIRLCFRSMFLYLVAEIKK